jgi:3-deoxy-manno-octulosonate cytidylyltransferase (CMP-KDO synthetase)
MKVVAIIPARYASTRFPGKPLVKILGQEMILRVLAQVKKAKTINSAIVATDDQRIYDCVVRAGYEAVMTDSDLVSGSDRVYQAAKEIKADWILNVQGDEPLIAPESLDALVQSVALKINSGIKMATLVHPLNQGDLENKNVVKVILNQNSEAIYFSRFPIPFSRKAWEPNSTAPVFRHLGVYLYQFAALQQICEAPESEVERAESLEQLRALHLGIRIQGVESPYPSFGVDAPEDVSLIEELLNKAPKY